MPDFPIIDAHIHLFDRSKVSYEWISKAWPEIDRPHLMADLEKAAGDIAIDKVIHCELLPDPGHQIREVEFMEELAATDPRVAAVTGSATLHKGADAQAEIEALASHPMVRGVRYHLPGTIDDSLEDRLVAGAKLLGRNGLHCEVSATSDGLGLATAIARRCPDVPMVLVHLGMTKGVPDVARGKLDKWRGEIDVLAGMDNLQAVKLSGTASVVDRAWVAAQVRPCLQHLLEAFGAARAMYASDWPASSFAHEYRDWVDLIDDVLSGASAEEKRLVYRDTASRVFRLS